MSVPGVTVPGDRRGRNKLPLEQEDVDSASEAPVYDVAAASQSIREYLATDRTSWLDQDVSMEGDVQAEDPPTHVSHSSAPLQVHDNAPSAFAVGPTVCGASGWAAVRSRAGACQ